MMSTPLNELLRQSEGRYLTPDEREQILAYARDLPARVRAAEEVEAREADILGAVVDGLRERYPRYERLFPNAWDRCARDVQLVLRYDVRAMLAADPRPLEDKALYYLRSILAAYNLTPQFARDCCALLRDRCRERLSPESFALLEPFLERNSQVLGDFPEPAVAMV
jgi:Phycobilisome protein